MSKKILIICLIFITSISLISCSYKYNIFSFGFHNNTEQNYKEYKDEDTWPIPPNYQGNPFANQGIGQKAFALVFEGLFENNTLDDKIYPRLAVSYEQNGLNTIIHLRKNVKWSDGKPFTSKDVWAYYILNNGTPITKYLEDIKTPDDYTVVFTWQNPAPNDRLKLRFIAMDVQGTIQYKYYKQYVDQTYNILSKLKKSTDYTKAHKTPFGLEISQKTQEELNSIWVSFLKSGPDLPLGTGAYKVQYVSSSDMQLVKNKYYWNKDPKFDLISLKSFGNSVSESLGVPSVVKYNGDNLLLIKKNMIYRTNGKEKENCFLTQDTLNDMLSYNKDLIFYQVADNTGGGVVFNLNSEPFKDLNVRKAINYILDRNKIKQIANPFAIISPYAETSIPYTYMQKWIPQDILNSMTKYNHDENKAAELLTKSGWHKGSDGMWKDKNGKIHDFTLVADNAAFPLMRANEIAAAELNKFGLKATPSYVNSSIFYKATENNNKYDMAANWLENYWGLYTPYSSFESFFNDFAAKAGSYPVFNSGSRKGAVNLTLKGPDGKMIDIDNTINEMIFMSDEDQKKTAGTIAWIMNENAFGVSYYQNVSGFFISKKYINGYPLPALVNKYDRFVPVQSNENYKAIIDDNYLIWSCQGNNIVNGTYSLNQ